MRKAVLMLVVLALAAPLYAANGDITLSWVDNGYGVGTLSYSVASGDDTPVGVALNVDIDGGQPKITSVTGIDSFFDVFVDYAYDMGAGYVYKNSSANSPVAKQAVAGETTLAADGLAFCISECGLDDTGSESAPDSGVIAVLSPGVNTATSGKISLNALRGGIVSENGAMNVLGLDGNGDLVFAIHPLCTYTGPDKTEWEAASQPQSWCRDYQCHGDTDGVSYDLGWDQWAPCGPADVTALLLAYKAVTTGGASNSDCDFDHQLYDLGWDQWSYCGPDDVTILLHYYKLATPTAPADCQSASPEGPGDW